MVLVYQYEVEVIIGNYWVVEIDVDLFVIIFGVKGDSGRRKFYYFYQEGDKFQRGKVSLQEKFLLFLLEKGLVLEGIGKVVGGNCIILMLGGG